MFEIRLDEEETKEERKNEEKQVEVLKQSHFCYMASVFFFSSHQTGSGPSQSYAKLPGRGGAKAQRLVKGEKGVEPKDPSDSAGRPGQYGRQLCL